MEHGLLGNNKMVQVGIIARDIDKTAADYAEFFGIDKPQARLTDGYEKTGAEYRGSPTRARAKLGFKSRRNSPTLGRPRPNYPAAGACGAAY